MQKLTIAYHNLGCKVNTYELDKIKEAFLAEGVLEKPFNEKADIYIINTCSVTHIADRKSRNMIRRCKKINAEALVVAMGCFVNSLNEEEKEKLKYDVDLFVPNKEKKNVISIIKNEIQNKNIQKCCSESHDNILQKKSSHVRQFIKIQDGCNMYCSYCIIPFLRKEMINREISEIDSEIKEYVKKGVKEVVLTGIHISSYNNLKNLIKTIANIQGLLRIRLGSLEPRIINSEFLELLESEKVKEKFCFEFHLSLQTGSNSVLKRMNRHYSKEDFRNSCDLIRKKFPEALISTDIIVGFPGETEEEFNDTLEFIKEIRFYNPHIFIYSARKGTKAEKMPNQVSESIKTQREKILIEEANKISNEIRDSYIGKEKDILVEEIIANECYGFTKEYVKVVCKIDSKKEDFLDNNTIQKVHIGDILKLKMQENCKKFILALL